MRPVEKGTWPLKGKSKTKKRIFTNWTNAIPVLKNRTGKYCHLCEMRIVPGAAIEHIKPKEHFPRLKANWNNFLLICPYCNSHKLHTVPKKPYRKNYFWPHLNNTLLVIDYNERGFGEPFPKTSLSSNDEIRAKNLIDLYGLTKKFNSDNSKDERFIARVETLKMAIDRLLEYKKGKATVNAIVDMAVKSGFFSIWYKLFFDEEPVRKALYNSPDFYCNKTSCFDIGCKPIRRNVSDY